MPSTYLEAVEEAMCFGWGPIDEINVWVIVGAGSARSPLGRGLRCRGGPLPTGTGVMSLWPSPQAAARAEPKTAAGTLPFAIDMAAATRAQAATPPCQWSCTLKT